ncbi:DUF945 family protein [Psychromonas hadalis]|uniref:DUF945 family protein n=1 Tax=Psychromonas hadalis TaxID=211669 RepID=UPI0003B39A87|nr:DUF945 family protein [Psychromonas hadalis]
MRKLSITLVLMVTAWLSMTYFVANMAEKEIKALLLENAQAELSIELLSYQRYFFSAIAITKVTFKDDNDSDFSLQITSVIHHYPYQVSIKNSIELENERLKETAQGYFSTSQWITSEDKINLFAQLTGRLTVVAGFYESETESLSTAPLLLDYHIDLKNRKGELTLNWAGLLANTLTNGVDLQSLQLISHFGQLAKQDDYDYQLKIEKIVYQQDQQRSLLEGFYLKGNRQQGEKNSTIDTSNELRIKHYQFNTDNKQIFTQSHIKLDITGLYQPAFELLNSGAGNTQEIEEALIALVNHGAQLKLAQLSSQTPWGEVNGKLDLVLDKGTPLTDIIINPYLLFDYMSGDASLLLPVSLLGEPLLSEPLQMGLRSGFLQKNVQTLNLQASFQQGELIVNGRVIPL